VKKVENERGALVKRKKEKNFVANTNRGMNF